MSDIPYEAGSADGNFGLAVGGLATLGTAAFKWMGQSDQAMYAAQAAPWTAQAMAAQAGIQAGVASQQNASANRMSYVIFGFIFMVILLRVRPQGNG